MALNSLVLCIVSKKMQKMKSKKEHNNKIAYMYTYTRMNNKANSERTGINIWCLEYRCWTAVLYRRSNRSTWSAVGLSAQLASPKADTPAPAISAHNQQQTGVGKHRWGTRKSVQLCVSCEFSRVIHNTYHQLCSNVLFWSHLFACGSLVRRLDVSKRHKVRYRKQCNQ